RRAAQTPALLVPARPSPWAMAARPGAPRLSTRGEMQKPTGPGLDVLTEPQRSFRRRSDQREGGHAPPPDLPPGAKSGGAGKARAGSGTPRPRGAGTREVQKPTGRRGEVPGR